MKQIYIFFLLSFSILLGDELTSEVILEAEKGQTFFKKNLRKVCRTTSANFAQKHTYKEWYRLKEDKKFRIEVYRLCPGSAVFLEDKWIESIYAFTIVYAKNTNRFSE